MWRRTLKRPKCLTICLFLSSGSRLTHPAVRLLEEWSIFDGASRNSLIFTNMEFYVLNIFWWSHMCMSGYCGFSIFYRGHRKGFKLCLAAKHPLKMCRFSKTARTFLSPRKKTYPKPSQIVFLQVCKYAPSLLLHTKTIRDIIDCTLKGGWLLL